MTAAKPLSVATLTYLGELAAGESLSSDEVDVLREAFPALVDEATTLGLAGPSSADTLLAVLVADPEDDELDNDQFNALCDRAAVLVAAILKARAV